MTDRDRFSKAALALVITGEIFAIFGIHSHRSVWWLLALLVGVLLIVIWIAGRMHNHQFSVRSVILTKLLANAIIPRRLGTIYLLFFVIHIGWLTNAAMSLFMPTDNLPDVLIAIAVCVIGMLTLIAFFPNASQKKDKNPIKVFVSGISSITVPRSGDVKDLNLRPLTRILQETKDETDSCELLILRSDFNKMNKDEIHNDIKNVLELLGSPMSQEIDKKMPIDQQLGILIKEAAKKEFPQKKWLDSLSIEFTNECNYNAFDECYKAIEDKLKSKDNPAYQLIFNLTPGTGIVGSLMTLLAIDSDRSLYYYSQDKTLPDNNRIKSVEKSKVPLQNLLSQALETFEASNQTS